GMNQAHSVRAIIHGTRVHIAAINRTPIKPGVQKLKHRFSKLGPYSSHGSALFDDKGTRGIAKSRISGTRAHATLRASPFSSGRGTKTSSLRREPNIARIFFLRKNAA